MLELYKTKDADMLQLSLFLIFLRITNNVISIKYNKRIAKNTLLLYFRMLFVMVVSLYTSRVL